MKLERKTKEEYLRDLARRSYNTSKGHKTVINAFEEYYRTSDGYCYINFFLLSNCQKNEKF